MTTAIAASQTQSADAERMAAFIVRVRRFGAMRDEANYRLYEALKADLQREFPAATPAEYTSACQAISRACNV